MRIKAKILILIISTLVLIIFVTAYYTRWTVEKNYEAALKDDTAKIVRLIELNIAAEGEVAAQNAMAKDLREMVYYSMRIIPDDTAKAPKAAKKSELKDPATSERAILKALNDSLEELMYLTSHVVRIDVFKLTEDGKTTPYFSKTRAPSLKAVLTPGDALLAMQGAVVLNFEQTDTATFANVIAPVRLKNGLFGLAAVKISREEFDRLITSKNRSAMITAAIAVAIIAGVLIIALNLTVNKPLENLLGAINRIKQGNLSATVPPVANDEIGRLTAHFNEMMQTIRHSAEEKEFLIKEINRANDELQEKIRQATEELRRRNDELSLANQSIYDIQKKLGHSRRLAAVGQLAATVAHELGTPLHSVSGHLQLLLDEPNLPKGTERRLTIMQSQLERITASIRNILDTTRRSGDAIDSVDLNDVIEDISILVLPDTVSKKITVKKDLQPGLPPVHGSRGRFEEVFLNLIDNAIDASRQGGAISIITKRAAGGGAVPPERFSAGAWIEVTIKDNGRGIPADYLAHIFEPFYTTKARGHGTGLGLSISQDIVKSYRGYMAVESKVNEGSAFSVFLPVAGGEVNS